MTAFKPNTDFRNTSHEFFQVQKLMDESSQAFCFSFKPSYFTITMSSPYNAHRTKYDFVKLINPKTGDNFVHNKLELNFWFDDELEVEYRYGYQGSEMDNEVKGSGNSYTTTFRQLDPRLGRWLTPDPAEAERPWQSPYCSMDNNPVFNNDPDGDIIPIILGIWAIAEVAMTAYDAYDTYQTVTDPNASATEKTLAVSGFATGLIAPGGGYGTAAKQTYKAVDKANDAKKVVSSTKTAIKKETAQKVQQKTLTYGERMANLKKMSYSKNANGSWSSSNYRNNLKKHTGKLGDGYDAHHVFLKSKSDWFKGAGIDVNDPSKMVWRNKKSHSGEGNVSWKHKKNVGRIH
ncbi:MAG: hypothetical protein PHQ74_05770 [Crocinitomicaceae bacterium]|nr:hypothetical protein [Crocinitomicaceae bacterium]